MPFWLLLSPVESTVYSSYSQPYTHTVHKLSTACEQKGRILGWIDKEPGSLTQYHFKNGRGYRVFDSCQKADIVKMAIWKGGNH